jgi:hypothetical protein
MSKRDQQQLWMWAIGGLALFALFKPKPAKKSKALPASTTGAQVIELERATEERAAR